MIDSLKINHKGNKKLLPYQYYQTTVENGRPDTLFHWHPELEINFVQDGSARYHIDCDFFNSEAGDIILIRPGGMHSIHPIDKLRHVTHTFQFHLDMIGYSILDQVSLRYLQPLQASTFKLTPVIKPTDDGYADIKDCLFRIFELVQEEQLHFELLLKAYLNELTYLLYHHGYVTRKVSDDTYRKHHQIRRVIDHINRNYAKALSIDYLADYMGYSKTHFMTVFKQQTGTSCTEFIIQVRLSKACEELLNTNRAIIDIASFVGFTNLSNFNRQFKRYYHLTPSQYRKQFKQSNEGKNFINPS
ncbi:helix-turn-helix domain-containing protein [Streptococcus sp. zg-JUN1979]|uniref:helix-turn-helix domain-containing protein n=1 Tax=Streptococcus sp. zg-JUN1979 TaxID=3391450 RepID=UPI0039A4BB13